MKTEYIKKTLEIEQMQTTYWILIGTAIALFVVGIIAAILLIPEYTNTSSTTSKSFYEADKSVLAYGLRELNPQYSGPLFTIATSTTNNSKQQDIYAMDDGTMDVRSLRNFCGTGDGYIYAFYDQSGNKRDATISDPSNMAQLVRKGVIITDDRYKKPACIFKGASTYAATYALPSSTTETSVIGVFGDLYNKSDNAGILTMTNIVDQNEDDSYYYGLCAASKTAERGVLIPQSTAGMNTIEAGSQAQITTILEGYFGSKSSTLYVDDFAIQSSDVIDFSSANFSTTFIGSLQSTSTSYFTGTFQEVVLFDKDMSDAHKNIYNSVVNFYNSK